MLLGPVSALGGGPELEHPRQLSAWHSRSSSTLSQREPRAWEPKFSVINPKSSSRRGGRLQPEHKAVANLLCLKRVSAGSDAHGGHGSMSAGAQVQGITLDLPHHSPCPSAPLCPISATLKGQFRGLNRREKALLLLSKPCYNTNSSISGPESPSPTARTSWYSLTIPVDINHVENSRMLALDGEMPPKSLG